MGNDIVVGDDDVGIVNVGRGDDVGDLIDLIGDGGVELESLAGGTLIFVDLTGEAGGVEREELADVIVDVVDDER
jgi:hypothetical protein